MLSKQTIDVLHGQQLLSIVTVLFWQSNTIPNSCIVLVPIIKSNFGAFPWYLDIRNQVYFLFLEHSRNVRSTTPALLFFVKAPLEVVFWPPFFLLMGMNGRDPFLMKLRSSPDPMPNRTRINLVFSTGYPRRRSAQWLCHKNSLSILLFASISIFKFDSILLA